MSYLTCFIVCDQTTYEIIYLIKLVINKNSVDIFFFIEMGQNNDSNNSTKEFAFKVLSIIIFACFVGGKISDFIK